MSKIDDLIKQYCPNGVEYKTIKELSKIETGKLNANAMVEGGSYKFFTCSKDVFQIDHYRWDTEAILIAGNGYLGLVHYYVGKFDAYQRTYVLTNFIPEVFGKYFYYCLMNGFETYAKAHTKEGSVPYITLKTVEDYTIPIPPLPVQEEIVRILDAFSSLEAELEAELEARKKQYEYYRNKLLNFNDNNAMGGGRVKFMQLGDVGKIWRGKRLTKNQLLADGQFPVYHGGIEPLGYYDQKNREKDTVMVINVGASAGTVGYSAVDFWSSDGCFCVSHSELYLNKYV